MAQIFRLEKSTLYMWDGCLNELAQITGTWQEEPFGTCSICGEIDLLTREEMDEYHNHMSNLQWEEDQPEPDYNPQELK